jgi:putative endonuclease
MRWLLARADAARHRARLRAWKPDHAAGRRGEDLAHRHLQQVGYTIVARNWRGAGGEIDVVAWHQERLVFVEVKSRSSDDFAPPERNIDQSKERALLRAASEYARRAEVEWEKARFDVVTIVFGPPCRIQVYRDAFSSTRSSSEG